MTPADNGSEMATEIQAQTQTEGKMEEKTAM